MVGVVGGAACPARQVSSIRPTVTYQNYRITVITVTLDADIITVLVPSLSEYCYAAC